MINRLSNTTLALVVTLLVGMAFSADISANKPVDGGKGSQFIEVTGFDDWLASPPSGTIHCQKGTFTGNPLAPCTEVDSRLKIRAASAQSEMFSSDERLAGLMSYVFSANFDASFSGPAWGTWSLEVESCVGAWEGNWNGTRTFVPGYNPLDASLPPPGLGGVWISDLRITGHGNGCVEGLQLKASETVTTLTPLPIAYEMIPGLCDLGCPPEGALQGRVLEPGWHGHQ